MFLGRSSPPAVDEPPRGEACTNSDYDKEWAPPAASGSGVLSLPETEFWDPLEISTTAAAIARETQRSDRAAGTLDESLDVDGTGEVETDAGSKTAAAQAQPPTLKEEGDAGLAAFLRDPSGRAHQYSLPKNVEQLRELESLTTTKITVLREAVSKLQELDEALLQRFLRVASKISGIPGPTSFVPEAHTSA